MKHNATESNAVSIQPAGPEHVEEIAALAAVIWRANYPGIISPAQIEYMLARMYALDTLREELEAGICYDRLLLAGTLAGFSAFGPSGRAGEAKLHKLYLHPAHQRQGLGSALLRHVEARVRGRDFRMLFLAVNKANAAAIAVYQRHGFTVRESVVVDIGGGFVMDDYVMEKRL